MKLSLSVLVLNRDRGNSGQETEPKTGKIKIGTIKIDPIKTPEGELRCSERVVSSCFLLVKSD
jgi:hypothetical protein